MVLTDFLKEIDDAVETVLDSSFQIEVTDTTTVPRFDDSYLTFDNLDGKTKKCRRLESCVLYVDIRNSAAISTDTHPRKLARLYSAFIRSMIKAAKYHNGHVRNVIGDRVMVIYDQENCFQNAVNTAVLMNSIAKYVIDKHYPEEFKCGIGIDYGKMLVTKAGEIRRGAETEFYRSLVWLGKPANVASRLTDLANKSFTSSNNTAHVAFRYTDDGDWFWHDESYPEFLDNIEAVYPKTIRYKNENYQSFFHQKSQTTISYPSILMTESVLDGFKKQCPQDSSVMGNWWHEIEHEIKEYTGKLYGADIIYVGAREL